MKNKKEYFNLVRQIMEDVRGEGFEYSRVFSEPRVTTGYRTKIWCVRDLPVKLCSFINYEYGRYVTAKVSAKKGYPYNVVFTPHEGFHDSCIKKWKSVEAFESHLLTEMNKK